MREIALHILDIARNSIEAGATAIELTIIEDGPSDRLEVILHDNGAGMSEAEVRRATDPFYSTRETRRVGLGLPLLAATCERSGGELRVQSKVGEGTTIRGTLGLAHLDRPPLGDMGGVIQALACESERLVLRYRHEVSGNVFEFDSSEIQAELGDVRLNDPTVLHWLSEYVNREVRRIGSKA